MSKIQQSTRKERVSWYIYDWANSAFSATVVTVFIGPYLTGIARTAADANGYIHPLGLPVYHGALFPYIVSLSVILQVFILPVAGTLADRFHIKKHLMIAFAYIGAFATMGLYFLYGDNYMLGSMLFILANLCFGASLVMYNAYLNDISEPENRDSVSSIGWATGYLGGGILLAANLVLFSNAESLGITTGDAVRISLASAGLWWAIFTIFPLFWLKTRKPENLTTLSGNFILAGFKGFLKTLKESRRYSGTLLFLAAYLLYNDGVQAVIALSAQFGHEELGLDISVLTTVILIVQFVSFAGALLFRYIAKIMETKKVIMLLLVLWIITLLYTYFYLSSETGFYFAGMAIGLIMGGTQALSRSLFSLLIPNGKEAEYFSLYEISERGTSWLGPLLFGLALQLTFSYRIAILSLVVFFIIGLILLTKVNVAKAASEAVNRVILSPGG